MHKKKENSVSACGAYTLPMMDTLDIVSGRWKLVIVMTLLHNGKMRFNELKAFVTGISGKVLSNELKIMETNKLLTRTVKDTAPITVEYELTEYGKTLEPVALALVDWGVKHRAKMFSPAPTEPA